MADQLKFKKEPGILTKPNKINPHVCCCCLSAGDLVNMQEKIESSGTMQSYISVINQCFNHQLLNETSSKYQSICRACIRRLMDSVAFKNRIVRTQRIMLNLIKIEVCPRKVDGNVENKNESTKKNVIKASADFVDVDDLCNDDFNCSDDSFVSDVSASSTKFQQTKYTPDNEKVNQLMKRISNLHSSRMKNIKPVIKRILDMKTVNQSAKRILDFKNDNKKGTKNKKKIMHTSNLTKVTIVNPSLKIMSQKRVENSSRKYDSSIFKTGLPSSLQEGYEIRKLMDLENNQCKKCLKKFKGRQNLAWHMNEHFHNYTCDKCGKGFATKKRHDKHLYTHIIGVFKCPECDKILPTRNKLSNHRQIHRETLYRCPICKIPLKSFYWRQKHVINTHGSSSLINEHKCEICSVICITTNKLNRHMMIHHSDRPRSHLCDICGKEFYDKRTLSHHMSVHIVLETHPCTVCSKIFPRKKSLVQHLKIHNNVRDHVCTHCGQAFVQKCSLKSHLRKHEKDETILVKLKSEEADN